MEVQPREQRYGVMEGRFCFEGGSHCGKGEGLHLLITDQAKDITDAFDQAAKGNMTQQKPSGCKSNSGDRGFKSRPTTRLSDFNMPESMGDTASALYEDNYFRESCGDTSPFWPSDERTGLEENEYRHETEGGVKLPWCGADHVTLERCNNCLTKLGAMSHSSTVALAPGTHFSPAWTMEAVPESMSDTSSGSTEHVTAKVGTKTFDSCQCQDLPPQRPPKPSYFDQKKPPAPLPCQSCKCTVHEHTDHTNNVGPYENYDIPKISHADVDNAEYYDTPKRIKKAIADDLFEVAKVSDPNSLILKKKCGCILKFGSKKKPLIVECDENLQPVDCPCVKVTNWANTLISLPYCNRSASGDKFNTEIHNSDKTDEALYATVDISRKTNRQSTVTDQVKFAATDTVFTNYQNVELKQNKPIQSPYANYENLEFALSLEFYENAKGLLKKAGVTQVELDALSANIDLANMSQIKKPCKKCSHSPALVHNRQEMRNKSDEYLLMEPPPKDVSNDAGKQIVGKNPGYTPMSPNPYWSQSLKHPVNKLHRVDIEKSLSIPSLSGNKSQSLDVEPITNKEILQKRSSSVDSARLLEDLKEFDSSIGSHATSSSLETLRNLALENRLTSPCDHGKQCYDCCKSSGSENKTSEEGSSKDVPHLRNKHIDNASIKRSSSVPCKGGNRDSSSSNDSGVSSCSLKHGSEFQEFEMPLTSGYSRYHYLVHKRTRGIPLESVHSSLPRKSKSSDPLRDLPMQLHKSNATVKSSSAEAEVPVLPPKQFKGVMDTHSTSSGTSDMSDYIETLSLTSSHSSSDTQGGIRIHRQPTNTLRPRSGKEYHNLDPIITSMYKNGKDLANYTNLP